FVPVIMGLGGAIGGQASTVAVRSLAAGRLGSGARGVGAFILAQAGVGAILGAACALLLGALAALLERNPVFALVVGLALFLALTVAAVVGALLPPLLRRVGVDPVVASGPLLGAVTDLTGILIYFGLATWLARHLGAGGG
ncbi:MAG TPA: magnesium transporter, partial [Thermoanaerobaculia bacterium]|nr:magnesium transporter [Thermoanaerobaculia bacterium]